MQGYFDVLGRTDELSSSPRFRGERAGVRGQLNLGDGRLKPLTPTLSPLARGVGDRPGLSRRLVLPRLELPKCDFAILLVRRGQNFTIGYDIVNLAG